MSATRGNRTLVAREREVGRIRELLVAAGEGKGGALVFRGEPGIGKTALLAYAREQAGEGKVLATRGLQAESDLPFSGLSELLGPVLGHLGDIPAPQRAALEGALALAPAVPGDRFAVYVGVLSLLGAAAEEAPLLVLVDDAHWLDSASCEALLFVARRLGDERIAMLFAVRDGEPSPFEEADLPELRLTGLDEEAATELLAEQGRALSPAVAERLSEATAGNPLALLELPSVLSEAQLEGREALDEPLPLIPALRNVYERRIETLSDATRRALTIAAANDSRSQREVMLAVEARGLAADALAHAELEGIIALSGKRVEFRHPLLRSAAYHTSPGPERRAAHEALAQVLAAEPSPGRRAWHRAAAALAPDEDVAQELEEAANEALGRGAPAAAGGAREVAARLSPRAEDRARRLQVAGRDTWLAGNSREAARLLEEALAQTKDPLLIAETKWIRGQVEMFSGSILAAREVILEAAELTEQTHPEMAVAMLADAAGSMIIEADPPAALETATRALELAEHSHVTVAPAALVAAATAETLRGNSRAGSELATQAKARLEMQSSPYHPWLVVGLAFVWSCLEREQEAYALINRIVGSARTDGALVVLPFALTGLCAVAFFLGDWGGAEAAGVESVRLGWETGQHSRAANALAYLACVEAARGDSGPCRAHAQEAIEMGRTSGAASVNLIGGAALGLLELGLGNAEAAAKELESVQAGLSNHRQPTVLRIAGDVVEANFRAGRTAEAEGALARLEEEAALTNGRWAHAVAARGRGLLAEETEFEAQFEEALRLHAEVPSPFSRARTQLSYGVRLRRKGRRAGARKHLTAGLDTFEKLGARAWAEKAERELTGLGVRVDRPTVSDADRLTPQELQVALAVAKGASNKEVAASLFISPRTVEAHLRGVYSKLGIRSRAELVRLVLEERITS